MKHSALAFGLRGLGIRLDFNLVKANAKQRQQKEDEYSKSTIDF